VDITLGKFRDRPARSHGWNDQGRVYQSTVANAIGVLENIFPDAAGGL
jgi:hypothetical protein